MMYQRYRGFFSLLALGLLLLSCAPSFAQDNADAPVVNEGSGSYLVNDCSVAAFHWNMPVDFVDGTAVDPSMIEKYTVYVSKRSGRYDEDSLKFTGTVLPGNANVLPTLYKCDLLNFEMDTQYFAVVTAWGRKLPEHPLTESARSNEISFKLITPVPPVIPSILRAPGQFMLVIIDGNGNVINVNIGAK